MSMEQVKRLSLTKTYWSMIIGLVIGLIAHVLFLFVFYDHAIYPLVYLNILSTIVFLSMLWLVLRKKILQAMVGASIELIIHQILAVYYVGWDYGFQYFLLVVPSVVLLGAFRSKAIPLMFTALSIAVLFILKLYSSSVEPIYIMPEIEESLSLINLVFTAVPIALFTGVFAFNSYRNEAQLLKVYGEHL